MFKKQIDVYLLILVFVSSLFFVANLFLVGQGLAVQNSPDENANLFFSQLFATSGQLQVSQPFNDIVAGLISPRSIRAVSDHLVPASFLGLPLIYGSLLKISSLNLLPFLTPIVAFLASIFLYLLLKNLLNSPVAFWSGVWLQLLPGWWYNANRVYLPNILFISVLIIFAYFLWLSFKTKQNSWVLVSGCVLGLTLLVRTSELVWIGPSLLVLLLLNRQSWKYSQIFLGILGILLSFWPVFYFNWHNYGNLLSFGYNLPTIGLLAGSKSLSIASMILLPFGFHPHRVILNLIDYLWLLSPLWSAVMIIGSIGATLYIVRAKNIKNYSYLAWAGLVVGYLLIYYGSWNFNDNPDQISKTIGSSFLRYWLPVFVLTIPATLWALQKFLIKKLYFNLAAIVVTFLLAIESLFLVIWGKDEGLAYIQNNLLTYQNFKNRILLVTPPNSIIISGRFDKVLFPDRQVIWQVPTEHWLKIATLAKTQPIYELKYNLNQEAVEYLNQTFYSQSNLKLTNPQYILDKWSIYRLINAHDK